MKILGIPFKHDGSLLHLGITPKNYGSREEIEAILKLFMKINGE